MDIKVCPHCGKKVLAIAKVCKHCRGSLRDDVPTTTPAKERPAMKVEAAPKPRPIVVEEQKTAAPKNESSVESAQSTSTSQSSAEAAQKPSMNIFSPKGRINRVQYLSIMAVYMLYVVFSVGSLFGDIIGGLIGGLLWYCFIVAGIKRSHDFDYCGWWILIPFWMLAALFIPGTKGKNQYGEEP